MCLTCGRCPKKCLWNGDTEQDGLTTHQHTVVSLLVLRNTEKHGTAHSLFPLPCFKWRNTVSSLAAPLTVPSEKSLGSPLLFVSEQAPVLPEPVRKTSTKMGPWLASARSSEYKYLTMLSEKTNPLIYGHQSSYPLLLFIHVLIYLITLIWHLLLARH